MLSLEMTLLSFVTASANFFTKAAFLFCMMDEPELVLVIDAGLAARWMRGVFLLRTWNLILLSLDSSRKLC